MANLFGYINPGDYDGGASPTDPLDACFPRRPAIEAILF